MGATPSQASTRRLIATLIVCAIASPAVAMQSPLAVVVAEAMQSDVGAPAPVAVAAATIEAIDALKMRRLAVPVLGVARADLQDTYDDRRGVKSHEAIDIPAPRGTPVIAVDDGRIVKLFRSAAGGLTVYQFDRDQAFSYYYAHLDRYADGVREGMLVKRGELIGYVGSTGNAAADAPHLHFAIFKLGPDLKWWKGTALNPYPILARPPC